MSNDGVSSMMVFLSSSLTLPIFTLALLLNFIALAPPFSVSSLPMLIRE